MVLLVLLCDCVLVCWSCYGFALFCCFDLCLVYLCG